MPIPCAPMTGFTSSIRYEHHDIRAAVIYCSDGRFAEHVSDFLHRGLGIPRCDRLAWPGGAACLAGHESGRPSGLIMPGELKFLIEAHDLDRVILIAHADCGHYAGRLGLTGDAAESQQKRDLRTAAAALRSDTDVARVEAYYARPVGDRVRFEPVPVNGDAAA